MSDINQISKDTINTHEQEETSLINDNFKSISISHPKSSILGNDAEQNHYNELHSEFESKKSTENDSEYEDVEEDDFADGSVLTSITNKSPLKTIINDGELHINIKPRRLNKKHQDKEHSEGEDDNQNVPKINHDKKPSSKSKEPLDDDNNAQSPAYIPRKGRFYEHDDRTLDENDRSKQEILRNENRFYTDSDTKWQHDLYFRDGQISKPRRDHGRFEHGNDYKREQLYLNDYISRSQGDRNGCYYQQQQYHHEYRRRVPQETEQKLQHSRTNNFDFKDYNRSLSYNRNHFTRDLNTQTAPRQQRSNDNPYQIDERTFHRRRNFTNSQFHQSDYVSKFKNYPLNRNDQRQPKENNNYHDHQGSRKYELSQSKNNLPPRLRMNNNYQNSTQKQEYSISNPSNMDRPKRYSNMRNNLTNSLRQQGSSSSQLKPYPDQHSNKFEQNDWPQAPPPPISYLPSQITTSQMYYQQQTSRYVPINYSQTSISEQVHIIKEDRVYLCISLMKKEEVR